MPPFTPAPASKPVSIPAPELRAHALQLLLMSDTQAKAAAVRQFAAHTLLVDCGCHFSEPPGVPGRPPLPQLVHPSALATRAVGSTQGHASLIHALTHIEANAINLALDIVWRFADLPEAFYRDWFAVAHEEAVHFELLQGHLRSLGHSYGDFPAHDGLWDMAARTRSDVLARLALVPRTLEARGLDVTPAIRKKLVSIGDMAGAKHLDIILRDEIGHVASGNRWYTWLCAQRGLDPIATYTTLAHEHAAPALKGPFNLKARRAAGFTAADLSALCGTPLSDS